MMQGQINIMEDIMFIIIFGWYSGILYLTWVPFPSSKFQSSSHFHTLFLFVHKEKELFSPNFWLGTSYSLTYLVGISLQPTYRSLYKISRSALIPNVRLHIHKNTHCLRMLIFNTFLSRSSLPISKHYKYPIIFLQKGMESVLTLQQNKQGFE